MCRAGFIIHSRCPGEQRLREASWPGQGHRAGNGAFLCEGWKRADSKPDPIPQPLAASAASFQAAPCKR